ncbi:aspartate 1-decarboxylase [candidate division GN15 bacterium]|uniref:Aspartate 1-decarboxylase n=1 Tax=candidate division GN15 bacterium TaxID=2072418 RepID=A0A855XAY2_9BACT|nr:MAG: aspartate 1-decarboxylase [candidate division GN15 bacterium]
MLIQVLKSKIHRATITDANLNYVGSITIDAELIKLAGLRPWEKVEVANINNGERLETYVIEGPARSGIIQLNGAAARKGQKGDLVIILAYGLIDQGQAAGYEPMIVHVDAHNRPTA